jgi:DNA-binding transcriptional ArsR family regulator
MNPQPAITSAAALIADPARAAMLLDGRAHPAGELAYGAGVSAQTASSHLAKLLAGGLLSVEREGRHRYYRLASPQVVSLLEHLASIGPSEPMRRRAPNRGAERLRFARCCYDHLAGSLGVGITKAMLSHGYLAQGDGKAFIVPPGGVEWFGHLGLDVDRITPGSPWHRMPVPRLDRA